MSQSLTETVVALMISEVQVLYLATRFQEKIEPFQTRTTLQISLCLMVF